MKITELLNEKINIDVDQEELKDFVIDFLSQLEVEYTYTDRDRMLDDMFHYYKLKFPHYFREEKIDKLLD